MKIKHFFDAQTATFSYVVCDSETQKCAIIDSVLDYDQFSGATSYQSADEIIAYVQEHRLEVEWILETHVHADHLTAAHYLKTRLGGKVAIGENITKVLAFWSPIFNSDFKEDGSDFDYLLKDNETITIGNLALKVMLTPGHTPACACYLIENAVFVGDTIFQPYVGTARTDFPGGSAQDLYRSVQKILSLPEDTLIYVGHDYPPADGTPNHVVTVKQQKQNNVMIGGAISEEEFVAKRNKKDENKAVPKLLLPALQFNVRAGSFGKSENNGIDYIKIPINQMG